MLYFLIFILSINSASAENIPINNLKPLKNAKARNTQKKIHAEEVTIGGLGGFPEESFFEETTRKERIRFFPSQKAEDALLRSVDMHYAESNVKAYLKRTIKLNLLGEEKISKGDLWIAKGKLRLDLKGLERNLLVVGSKVFWAVTTLEEGKGPSQILTGKIDRKAKDHPISFLSGGLAKKFKTTGIAKTEKMNTYFLQPKKELSDIRRAQLTFDEDLKTIKELKFWDTRDNETTYEFLETEFNIKVDQKLFEYTPPKDVDVIRVN